MPGKNVKVSGLAKCLGRVEAVKQAAGTASPRRVGTNVEYAPYQEFGTATVPAHPFLRPAAEEVRANAGQYVRETRSLDQAIHHAALDLERRAKQKAPVDTGRLRNSIRAYKP